MGKVNIELLVVPDCPNEGATAALLRQALTDIGLSDTAFTTRVVTGQQQAEELGFTGSPTILINGSDAFPEPGRPPGLACRVYRTTSGASGLPDVVPLRQALKQSADSSARPG